ncbi:hypothetical protein ACFLZ4_00690 [Patescibacteria group bacterium]
MKKKTVNVTFIYPRFCEFLCEDNGICHFIKLVGGEGVSSEVVATISLYKKVCSLDAEDWNTNIVLVATDEEAEEMRKFDAKRFTTDKDPEWVRMKEIKIEDGDAIILRPNTVIRHKDLATKHGTSFDVDVLRQFRMKIVKFQV